MGVFINVSVDSDAIPDAERQRIVRLCPVDIFALEGQQLAVVEANEDECTLCDLCLKAAPAGTIRIHKAYSGETLVSG